jgi:hypothetical protein
MLSMWPHSYLASPDVVIYLRLIIKRTCMSVWLTLPQNGIARASCDVRAYHFREDQYCRAPSGVA